MVLAIDGPAGVGKSTVSKRIAQQPGMFYLNSGNFYRAVTLSALEKGVDPRDEKKIIEVNNEKIKPVQGESEGQNKHQPV